MRIFVFFALAIWMIFGEADSGVRADEVAAPPVEMKLVDEPKITPPPKRRAVEKEAEGTKAPNRFESDPIIRSEYEHEGNRLEVDPD